MNDTREQLAEVLREVWLSGAPFRPGGKVDYPRFADAVLASGVLDQLRADAWDEGWEHRAIYRDPPTETRDHDNPYRNAGSPDVSG